MMLSWHLLVHLHLYIIIPPIAAMPWIIANAGIALLLLIFSPDVTSLCIVVLN